MDDPKDLKTINLESGGTKLALTVPNDHSTRYAVAEIFKSLCYQPVAGAPAPKAILDIGANVGLAAAFFRLAYPNALIHCVEPDPFAFRVLEKNAPRIKQCILHNVGLYDSDRAMTFNSSPRPSLSSLAVNPITDGTTIQIDCRNAGPFVRALDIDLFDLIKIDTEGAELPILRSLGDIFRKATVIHVEFHSHADRRNIDDLLTPTHLLWSGAIDAPHRGQLTYVASATAEKLVEASSNRPLVIPDQG